METPEEGRHLTRVAAVVGRIAHLIGRDSGIEACRGAEGVAPANSQAKGPFGTGGVLRTLESDGEAVHRRGARGFPS